MSPSGLLVCFFEFRKYLDDQIELCFPMNLGKEKCHCTAHPALLAICVTYFNMLSSKIRWMKLELQKQTPKDHHNIDTQFFIRIKKTHTWKKIDDLDDSCCHQQNATIFPSPRFPPKNSCTMLLIELLSDTQTSGRSDMVIVIVMVPFPQDRWGLVYLPTFTIWKSGQCR